MYLEKKVFFKTMAQATRDQVEKIVTKNIEKKNFNIIKHPEKMLVMLPMYEPVNKSQFYIGEMLVCQAVVENNGVQGYAVTQGDDFDKTLNIAILDGALNLKNDVSKKIISEVMLLLKGQKATREIENSKIALTSVNFETMEGN